MLKAYYLDKKSNKVYGVKVSRLELSWTNDEKNNENERAWEIRRIEFESVDGSIRCVNAHENRYDVTNILDSNRCCYLYQDKECTQLLAEFCMDGCGNTNLILGKYGHRRVWYDDDMQIGFDLRLEEFMDDNKYLVQLDRKTINSGLRLFFYHIVVYGGNMEREKQEVVYDAVNDEILFTPYIRFKDRKVDAIFANSALANEFIQSQREVIDFEEEETPNETKKKELQSKLTELQKEIENIKTEISLLA